MNKPNHKNSIFSKMEETAQILEFMFSNVVYKPTVYKTG